MIVGQLNKEIEWAIKVVDLAADRKKCSRQYVLSAKRTAKFLLSPEKIDRSYARIVFLRARIPAAK